ncbi:hypothetical protein [Paenibacillus sp. FSL E2-0178]|uniref:hypothetical protein n=1 Tax=Paenibacillus sp. FSL E2-0178 TaxID=2921361 RepID=UPI003158950D
MQTFYVHFTFVGGDTHNMIIEANQYAEVAIKITESRDGWFGVKGDVVNLRNVTKVKIREGNAEPKEIRTL